MSEHYFNGFSAVHASLPRIQTHHKRPSRFPPLQPSLRRRTGSKSSARSTATFRPPQRKREMGRDQGSGGEITYLHGQYGHKLTGIRRTKALVNAATIRIRQRWLNIQPYYNTTTPANYYPTISAATWIGGGSNYLPNVWGSGASNSTIIAPFHCWDLTAVANTNKQLTTAYTAFESQALSFTNTTGGLSAATQIVPTDIAWTPLAFHSADGTQATGSIGWTLEEDGSAYAGNTAFSGLDSRRALLKHVAVKFLCYGASQYATRFTIRVFKLRKEFLCPGEATTDSNQIATRRDFYESLLKRDMANPIATVNNRLKGNMHILKEWDFTLQPRLTNESDPNVGHMKKVELWLPLNKMCKFDWVKQDNVQADATDNANAFSSTIGDYHPNIPPLERIFLSIQATACYQKPVTDTTWPVPAAGGVGQAFNFFPSYDANITRCWDVLRQEV
nr:MAG: capsid protein [Cressdnaviricota sp.]